MSEKLYSQAAGAQANAQAGQANAEGPKTDENGNVYNADYNVEDNGKDNK